MVEKVDADGPGVAVTSRFACADVVLVGAAVALVLAVDKSALVSVAGAFSAVQEPSEVVEVDAVSVAGVAASIEHTLDGDEQLLGVKQESVADSV
ncbi:hypothetical protein [Microbacterium sp. 4NA327F11]|uniref:hypothetical protein n=1 Tax=Microbacterium sp. 4NA327F11 TaxID=2502229 RepID=UPI0020162E14|nr:hypothetical protein [Microbacterium sp. 4NA327F11]